MGCSSSAQACTLAKSRVSLEKKQDRNDSPFSMISPAKGSENTGGGGGCACCSCWFYISAVKTEVMRSVGIASAFCRSRRRWSAKERSAEETICEGTIGTGGATRDHGFPRRPDHIAAIGNVFSGVRDHRQSFQFSTLHRDVVPQWKAAIRQDSSSTAQNVVVVATWLHGNWYLTNLFWAVWQTWTWEQPQRPTGVDCKTSCKIINRMSQNSQGQPGRQDPWQLEPYHQTALQTCWCGLNWGYDVDKKKLGEGSYGTVSICTNKAVGKWFWQKSVVYTACHGQATKQKRPRIW